MSGTERCDEILRMIDDVLVECDLGAVGQEGAMGSGLDPVDATATPVAALVAP